MARCLKCNYELTFLEKRRRYKCAKCGSLFLKKEIDELEFQKFNKEERKKDRKLVAAEKKIKSRKKRSTLTLEDRREKRRLWHSENYKKNRDKILARRKEIRAINKEVENKKRKERRHVNIDDTRQQGRIQYWRKRQKLLAEDNAEFIGKSLSKG